MTSLQERPRIFISYLRDEAATEAARLRQSLEDDFGPGSVFQDLDMSPGTRYRDELDRRLDEASVVLILLTKDWLTARDEQGVRRIGKTTDLANREITRAIQRRTPLIPILIDDTPTPKADELPTNIADLIEYQPARLRSPNWEHDFLHLTEAIRQLSAQSIGHRDVRPGNVQLRPPNEPTADNLQTVVTASELADGLQAALDQIERTAADDAACVEARRECLHKFLRSSEEAADRIASADPEPPPAPKWLQPLRLVGTRSRLRTHLEAHRSLQRSIRVRLSDLPGDKLDAQAPGATGVTQKLIDLTKPGIDETLKADAEDPES